MTNPASAGPITRPRFHCADDSATAPGTSSRGTRSGSIAWNAGKPIAFAQPGAEHDQRHQARARVAQAGDEGQQRGEHDLERRAWRAAACGGAPGRRARRRAVRATRSAGSPAAATSPVQPALPVAVVTRMPTPIVSIQVPMFDTNAPAQSSANRRCRNGANALERSTVADGTRLLHERSGRATNRVEHEVIGCERAVPVVRRDLLEAAAPGERANELEVVDAQRRHRLARAERRRWRRRRSTHERAAVRRGRAAHRGTGPTKPKLSITASDSRAPGAPSAPRTSCSWVTASDSELARRAAELPGHLLDDGPVLVPLGQELVDAAAAPGVDLGVGPRVGPDAVEVARTRCRW